MASTGDGMRRDLSTVSTILGLTLFCILLLSLFFRRFLIQRRQRALRDRRARSRARGGNIVGLAAMRADFEGEEDGEPRTVAIGARATVVRLPRLWNTRLIHPNHDEKGPFHWNDANPIALQLTTPHTTAEYPSKAKTSPRIHRLYPTFLFHHSNNQGSISSPAGDHINQHLTNPPDNQKQSPPLEPEKELKPHPVMISYVISMPNPHSPSYSSPFATIPSTRLPNRIFPDTPNPDVVSQLEIGTALPIVNLPSVVIPEQDLRTWWDTSVTTFAFPTSRTGTTVYASPYYATFRDQRNAQTTLRGQQEEVISTTTTVPDVVWTTGYGRTR